MLTLNQELEISNMKFPAVTEVTLESSREIPTDILTVKLPKYKNLKKDSIVKFSKVTWKAGYTRYGLLPEFSGYVLEISPKVPLELKCADPFFFCQRKIMTRDYHQKPLMTFLNDCIHPQIKSDISIVIRDSDIKRTVDIRCAKKSARYALSELKKTHGVDVFFHDWKLVVQKAFKHPNLTFASKGNQSKSQKQNTSEPKEKFPIFRFTQNIIEDDLTPLESKPFQIVVRGENPKTGQNYRGVYGEGEARYYEIDGLDSGGAEKRAKEIFDDKCGSGFKGKFISFGYPSITHSQIIDIQDPEDSSRSAKVFVDRVIKKFNTNGYRQEIYPGLYHEPPRTGSSKSNRKK
ncbi:hypothetical protein [Leptospira alstonii]|uniref:Phage late control protein D protein n=2 Tax=Leptospira alstonii TaxID=28452 RepID=M6D0T8_9LEPT|nr:hypothetical protein [Leptospira alstonii]EMJ92195.1 hypothetical protein LEP1GSC194_3491 [Leptospira alstonii serovar Sichuan str. 79601]EQA80561.1 hypothetical protein LEP1GSC193_3355 [Leptospira alstonii serovar Pingchang str. 80-412]